MNSINQKGKAALDKNYSVKEDTLKTKNISDRIMGSYLLTFMTACFLIIALSLITQPFSAEAKGRFSPPISPNEIIELMTERLDLTEEQVAAIQPIIEEKIQRRNEIRSKAGADRSVIRTEIQKLRWDTEIRLNEILTDEQVEKYLELKQEHREKMHRGKFRGGKMRGGFNKTPEQVMERLRARLALTEEQEVAIKPIIKESIKKRREVFDKYKDEGLEARESMRNEMQTIGDETHAQLSTVLTDEQMEKLITIKEEKRARMDRRMNRPGPRGF